MFCDKLLFVPGKHFHLSLKFASKGDIILVPFSPAAALSNFEKFDQHPDKHVSIFIF